MNTEYTFEILSEEYGLTNANVAEYRRALSFSDEYAEYVRNQAYIVIESIQMGQSVLSIGELMTPLFNATHKYVTSGYELDLPGVEYFKAAAEVAFNAVNYISEIATMTEQYPTAILSCDETVNIGYM